MIRRIPAIVFSILTAGAVSAAPPCNVQGLPGATLESAHQLEFDTASTRYVMTAAVRGTVEPPQAYHVGPDTDPSFVFIPPRVAADGILDITILGTTVAGEDSLVCSTRLSVPIRAHAPLKSVADRLVIPGVGTTPGANGSQWKTSLQLVGFGSGTAYFRPLGTFHGDDRDPHVRYELGPMHIEGIPGVLQVDDLSAAMGVTGIGHLDIVPDFIDEGTPPFREGYIAPRAEARVYNDSGQGQFGGIVRALTPTQLQRETLHIIVPAEYPARARVSVGLRTFDRPAKILLGEYFRELGLAIYGEIEIPPHTYRHMPLAELYPDAAGGANLLLLGVANDAAFAGYYSVTDNVTNDTEVYTAPDRWHYPRLRDVVIPHAWFF